MAFVVMDCTQIRVHLSKNKLNFIQVYANLNVFY